MILTSHRFRTGFLVFMTALHCEAVLPVRNSVQHPSQAGRSRFLNWAHHPSQAGHSHFLPLQAPHHQGWIQGLRKHIDQIIRHDSDHHGQKAGHISLVGAGPGDPNLLTLQAMKLIQNADLVIADRLISKEILDLVTCELKVARKYPGCAEKAQQEIYDWANEAYAAGKNVLRLKIGDPFLFGRGGEEVLYFRDTHGIEVDVVPGVSASYAAPLVANIPLTHRGVANKVVISTGYGRDGGKVDVPAFVEDQTVVLLMAVGRLKELSQQMLSLGYPPSTPVAIIEKASTPQQREIVDRLDNIAITGKKENVKAPATIVIGEVVGVLPQKPLSQTTDLPLSQHNGLLAEISQDVTSTPSGELVGSSMYSSMDRGAMNKTLLIDDCLNSSGALIGIFVVSGLTMSMLCLLGSSSTADDKPLLGGCN